MRVLIFLSTILLVLPALADVTRPHAPGVLGFNKADTDGNGLYETSFIWDADGDGSTYVTCSAKDAEDPACKASGEIVYRDLADDLNCAMHGCGFGQMEPTGHIKLREGVVYVNWPCWDAAEPTGFNDPTAANDDLHDSTSDTAYSHCPATPAGRRFITIATMNWQGTISGAGWDHRNPEVATSYKRDRGTYIVDDRGPAEENQGVNVWFGADGHIRGFGFGYAAGLNTVSTAPSQSGEFVTDGDSPGYGSIVGTQDIVGLDAEVCVANTSAAGTVSADNWASALEAGDIIIIRGTSSASVDQARVNFPVRVRDTPAQVTGCNSAGQIAIPLGGRVTSGTSATTYGVNPPLIKSIYAASNYVYAVRSDYTEAGATLEHVTIEPQDWWNETSGDCINTGVWTSAADQAASDHDCDTSSLIGIWGGGRNHIRHVAIRHFHDRSVDGAANWGHTTIEDVVWLFGQGGPISDPAYGFVFNNVEVSQSQFDSDIFNMFGPGIEVNDLRVNNSTFAQVFEIGTGSRYNRLRGVQVFASAFGHVIAATCGAEFNVLEDVTVAGNYAHGGTAINGRIARFLCDDDTDPIKHNVIRNVMLEGPGHATSGTFITQCAVVLDTNSGLSTPDNTDAVRDNHFDSFRYVHKEDANQVSLFCNQDDGSTTGGDPGAGNYVAQNVLWKNSFSNSSIAYEGTGDDKFAVYQTCGLGVGTNICLGDIKSDADASITNDPSGCNNFESGLVGGVFTFRRPTIQDCL